LAELNTLIEKLDKRAEKFDKSGMFRKKNRQEAADSNTLPPGNAPSWAIDLSHSQNSTPTSSRTSTPTNLQLSTATPTGTLNAVPRRLEVTDLAAEFANSSNSDSSDSD